jgi:hypothetical protein
MSAFQRTALISLKAEFVKMAAKFTNNLGSVLVTDWDEGKVNLFVLDLSYQLYSPRQKCFTNAYPSSMSVRWTCLVHSPHSLTYYARLTYIDLRGPASLSFGEYPSMLVIRRPRLPKYKNGNYTTLLSDTIG